MSVVLQLFSGYTAKYYNWLCDPEVNQYTQRAGNPPTPGEAIAYSSQAQTSTRVVFSIHIEKHGHIGNISLQNIDKSTKSAELALLIGEKEAQGQGFGLEAAQEICKFGFENLGLQRIYCGTHFQNKAMQRLALKLGMRKEGRSRKAMLCKGKLVDRLHYGILKKEFYLANSGFNQSQSLSNNNGGG